MNTTNRIIPRILQTLAVVAAVGALTAARAASAGSAPELQRVVETLVAPPNVPAFDQVVTGPPRIIQVRMEVQEKQIEVEDGVRIWAMTFNGSVPGPLIVAHQNDYVELTLVNPATNTLIHNIDFHAATGALGGGGLTQIAPGQQTVLRFKAVKAGVFVYHCAPGGAMIPLHVVSGMNGAIMVLPRNGLSDENGQPLHFDRAYFIGEQDFYVTKDENGRAKQYGSPAEGFADMLTRMSTLTPSYEVFNGKVGALTGDNAMTANVGENVLFIHSQANRDTRPHLIGGHADYVWLGGSFANAPMKDFETWLVPGGSAVAAMYRFRQPGTYAYVNHNLIEAVMLGALAQVKVEGTWDDDLMMQVEAPQAISP